MTRKRADFVSVSPPYIIFTHDNCSVDDLLISSTSETILEDTKEMLGKRFRMKQLAESQRKLELNILWKLDRGGHIY